MHEQGGVVTNESDKGVAMMTERITRAMAALIVASAKTSDWQRQQKILKAYDRLAELRRASLRGAGE